MKYHFLTKALALILAACCLMVAAGCGLGIVFCTEFDLYEGGYEDYTQTRLELKAGALADHLANSYAARTLSDMTPQLLQNYGYTDNLWRLSNTFSLQHGYWSYAIYLDDGNLLQEKAEGFDGMTGYTFSSIVGTQYVVEVEKYEDRDFTTYYGEDGQPIHLAWNEGPVYRVDLVLQKEALYQYNTIPAEYIELAETWRYGIIALLVASLAMFVALCVYLCWAAGRSKAVAGIRPGGLNRLPLDLYAGVVAFLVFWCVWLLVEGLGPLCFNENNYLNAGMVALFLMSLFAGVMLVLGWFFALAAQVKMPRLYFLRHTCIGWLLMGVWKMTARCCRFCFRGIAKLCRMMPMIWQRIVTVAALLFTLLLMVIAVNSGAALFFLFLLLVLLVWGTALFAYDLYGFRTLMKGAKAMAKGSLQAKINTRYLIGPYREHAEHLNAMADVALVAAREQVRSDRMKTELITNVSHDLKTPLTSIINFVDLLEKPHTEQEGQQYLQVLSRQSNQLKKLVEDLMEMSKASSGNISVSLQQLDVAETVNQALGEYADKLALAGITPVLSLPEETLAITADGRLTWRVLGNLLSNIVKYALPGTRMYLNVVDLTQSAGVVQLSLKNISRDPLNISAQELTERFVRGDASRNTEGSGLGLNIAKTLMELQKGSLELLVDGDLFKVTLTFPAA